MKNIELQLSNQVESLVKEYYTNYYKNTLALGDWEDRVLKRLGEEEFHVRRLMDIINNTIKYDFSGKHVLIAGAGTGAEVVAIHKRNGIVYGIEPNEMGMKILEMKSSIYGFNFNNFSQSGCESLPFPDGHFDFIFCFSVLEHVNDVYKSIQEMLRVLKLNTGILFIHTADYLYPADPHYKVYTYYPPAFPFGRLFFKIFLRLHKRPVGFVDSLVFVNSISLARMFRKFKDIYVLRINQGPAPEGSTVKAGFLMNLMTNFFNSLNIAPNLWLFIKRVKK